MSKLEGAKTVVLGGKQGVKQQYCGVVGGQSTDFSRIDSEIKVQCKIYDFSSVLSAQTFAFCQTVGLKNHTLAPPDL